MARRPYERLSDADLKSRIGYASNLRVPGLKDSKMMRELLEEAIFRGIVKRPKKLPWEASLEVLAVAKSLVKE